MPLKVQSIRITLEEKDMEILLEGKMLNIDLNIKIDESLLKKHLYTENQNERVGKTTRHVNTKKNRRST